MQHERLAVFGNLSPAILINAALVVAGHTVKLLNVLTDGLLVTGSIDHIGAVRQIAVILGSLAHPRTGFADAGLAVHERSLVVRLRIGCLMLCHDLILIDLGVGIVIPIGDVQVGFEFHRAQVDQHKLACIFCRPLDVANLAVDNRFCAIACVPNHGLIIPNAAGLRRFHIPVDAVIFVPFIVVILSGTHTIGYRDFRDRIVLVLFRHDDANVTTCFLIVINRRGARIHIFLRRQHRVVRIDDRKRQRYLTITSIAIGGDSNTPVLCVRGDVLCDFRLLQVICDQLIAGEEIVPDTVRSLILPRALIRAVGIVADIGQRRTVTGAVSRSRSSLFVVLIQAHGLPIGGIHLGVAARIVFAEIAICRRKRRYINTCGIRCCRARDHMAFLFALVIIYMTSCDHVLKGERIRRERIRRQVVIDDDVIPCSIDLNIRRSYVAAGDGDGADVDGGLSNRNGRAEDVAIFADELAVGKATEI